MSGIAVVTLVLAVITLSLVGVTYRQLRSSIRPLLADPKEPTDGDEEVILFGAPGRDSPKVAVGRIYYYWKSDVLQISVPFENIGSGPAAIVRARTSPDVGGSIYISRKFIPVGGQVRVNVSILLGLARSKDLTKMSWAVDGFSIAVEYTDANRSQKQVSSAEIRQYATQGPHVREISITRRRWWGKNSTTRGIGTY